MADTGFGVAPTKKKSTAGGPRHPKREVIRGLARFLVASKSSPQLRGTTGNIDPYLKGLSPKEVQRTAKKAGVPQDVANALAGRARAMRDVEIRTGSGFDLSPVSLVGQGLKQFSRPVQAGLSAVAEQSRQGEQNPINVGPVSIRFVPHDMGKVLDAAKEGFLLKRHDSPASTIAAAGRIREKQGENTKPFGVVPGTDLRKGEVIPYAGKAGVVATDVAVSAAVDPLSYVTFGVSSAARQGLVQTERVLGAERAAAVAERGVGALNAEEKARLGVDVVKRLRNVRGGIGVRLPQVKKGLQGERLLGPSRTVVPGKYLGGDLLKAATRTVGKTKAGAAASELFVPRSRLIQAEREGRVPVGTAARVEGMQATARGTSSAGHAANVAYLRRVAKETKLSDEEAFKVAVALDTDDAAELTGKARLAFDKVDEYRKGMSARVRAAGLIPEEGKVDAAGNPIGVEDPSHYPHVPRISGDTKPGEVRLGAPSGQFSVTEGSVLPGFAKKRTGGTLQEEIAGGKNLETNPFAAYASRSMEQERALAAQKFTDEALSLTDSKGDALLRPVGEGRVAIADQLGIEPVKVTDRVLDEHGFVRKDLGGGLGEFIIHKDIAPEFEKLVKLRNPTAAGGFLRGLDKWMTLWKGYATVPLPFGLGFHMRNAMGNFTLNWLADISPSDPAYAQAYTLQRRIAKGMKEGKPLQYLNDETRLIAQEALRRDIIGGGGFFIEDIPLDTLETFKSKGKQVADFFNPVSANNALIRPGRAFGKGIEENARLAHFISKYREFGNFDDAAASVRKYLFDYADLTEFERAGLKRVIPFYTFARKNTPLWVAAAVKTPGKYSRLAEWRTALLDASGRPTSEVMPSYLEGSAGVPLPFQMGGKTPIFAPDLPPMAASEVLDPLYQTARTAAQGKTPSPGPILEGLVGQSGGGLPGLIKAGIESYPASKDFFSGRQFYTDKERFAHLLEQVMPLIPKIKSAVPSDAAGKEKQARRLISMLSGLQLYPLGPQTKRSAQFGRAEEIQALLRKLRSQGVDVPDQLKASTGKKGLG